MSASAKLLLPAGVLCSKPEGKIHRISDAPGPLPSHSSRVAGSMAWGKPQVRGLERLYPTFVSSRIKITPLREDEPGLWARYGRGNTAGTRVYNSRGEVIYELSEPTTRKS